MGDFNRNLRINNCDTFWLNVTLSLGLSQLIRQPTRVTSYSRTLKKHIYTNREDTLIYLVSISVIRKLYAIFFLLLSSYLCFISLLYLDLYVLGDDALIS